MMSFMPIARRAAPEHSRKKLVDSLKVFRQIKAIHKRWMTFSLTSGSQQELYPHPVYGVRLNRLLEGKPLSATLKKIGWIYFLRQNGTALALGEVSIVSGKHKNARVSEGPFVKRAFQLIDKSNRDPRVRGSRYELRSLRLDSLHLFCLWLKPARGREYFIPVSSHAALEMGKWTSRKELTKALRSEGERVRTAQVRMSRLLKGRQA
jgi:hypothetical protein